MNAHHRNALRRISNVTQLRNGRIIEHALGYIHVDATFRVLSSNIERAKLYDDLLSLLHEYE